MSKVAIVLCTVLFASANAFSWEESFKTVQLNVDHVINSAILKGEEDYIINQSETMPVTADLSDITSKFGAKIWDDINRITRKVTIEINALTAQVKDVFIDDCLKISDELDNVTQAAITSTSSCLDSKLISGLQYINVINKETYDVMTSLKSLKEKAEHCGDRINGAKSAAEAMACSKAAATDATWLTLKSAPKLTIASTKLKFLLVTLPHYLGNCYSSKPLVTFYEQSSTAVERTQKCIQRKMEETRSGTADPFVPESGEDTNSVDSREVWLKSN